MLARSWLLLLAALCGCAGSPAGVWVLTDDQGRPLSAAPILSVEEQPDGMQATLHLPGAPVPALRLEPAEGGECWASPAVPVPAGLSLPPSDGDEPSVADRREAERPGELTLILDRVPGRGETVLRLLHDPPERVDRFRTWRVRRYTDQAAVRAALARPARERGRMRP